MSASSLVFPGHPELPLLQGWYPEGGDQLAQAWANSGGAGMLRLPAFPDPEELRLRLRQFRARTSGSFGLDIRGVLGPLRESLDVAIQEGATFLLQGSKLSDGLRQALDGCTLPRLASVSGPQEARVALSDRIEGLILEGQEGWQRWMEELRSSCNQSVLANVEGSGASLREWFARGLAGFQVRSPRTLRDGEGVFSEFRRRLSALGGASECLESRLDPLPRLRIRNLNLPYPVVQGGMGVGVSWSGLAGAVARNGCVGTVSAIGTAYGHPEGVKFVQGRPNGPQELNSGPALRRIIHDALENAQGHGAVAVNVLCAINDYDRVVREAVDAGAQMVISGAGLPLGLPELTKGSDAALVPIVSSARALKLLCKTWERKHGRLPDAVVLEGPESGGHQGYSPDQCVDPAFALESILPQVIAERDQWGSFPVIVAGGIWDNQDIRRFLALGAGGVQMGTRFVGTFECDASNVFKEVLLRSRKEDIQLMKSPVGMPARGVRTQLLRDLEAGTAPRVACISKCLVPCEGGKGAMAAGYCIADRLADAYQGKADSGLFFSGSNGYRLQELVSVRELVETLTGDFGLERLASLKGN